MVYFVQEGSDGPIKIGYANDVKLRLNALQGGNSRPLRVLVQMPGDIRLEGVLLRRFSEGRVAGEWFRADTPGLADFVAEARAWMDADEFGLEDRPLISEVLEELYALGVVDALAGSEPGARTWGIAASEGGR